MSELSHRLERVFRRYPPRRYHLEDYKRWFPKTANIFLSYLQHSPVLPVAHEHEGDAVGVVVLPWVSTPVPWYAIMLAIGLLRRGRKVVVLWDDTGFPEQHLDDQNRAIAGVIDYVRRFLPVTRLSDQPAG